MHDAERSRRHLERLPEVLTQNGLDGWVLFTRESAPDPLAAEFGGGKAVARMALVFGNVDGALRSLALCASYDVTPLDESGLYDEVVGYGSEGVKPHLAAWLPRFGPGRLGMNVSRDIPAADGLAAGMRDYLAEAVGPETAGRLVSAEGLVVDLFSRRSPEEIALIEEAARRSHEVLTLALTREYVTAGKTSELALEAAITRLVEQRGDRVEFLSINAGPTRGHSTPTELVISPGDLLRIDFGIRHRGWTCDIQRTAWVSTSAESTPPEPIRRMWSVNREAFRAALAGLRPRATGLEVDSAARRVVEKAGFQGYPHGTGHTVGMRVHDIGPILGPDWPERYGSAVHLPLREDQVFAVEPIVYAPDPVSGATIHIGLENDVVVTRDGCRLLGEDQAELWII